MALCLWFGLQTKAENTDISSMENVIYIEPVTAVAGTEVTLSVRMKNAVEAEGFGFDLYLPDGVSFVLDEDGFPESYLSTERTTTRKTNNYDSAIQADGSLRVFAYSTNGSTIKDNDGEVWLVKVKISEQMTMGDYPIILKEEAISKTDGKSINIETSIETTLTITDVDAIESISTNVVSGPSYNLRGQRVTGPQKGVNIIGGKKVVVK